jgi:hypothetical protein
VLLRCERSGPRVLLHMLHHVPRLELCHRYGCAATPYKSPWHRIRRVAARRRWHPRIP